MIYRLMNLLYICEMIESNDWLWKHGNRYSSASASGQTWRDMNTVLGVWIMNMKHEYELTLSEILHIWNNILFYNDFIFQKHLWFNILRNNFQGIIILHLKYLYIYININSKYIMGLTLNLLTLRVYLFLSCAVKMTGD